MNILLNEKACKLLLSAARQNGKKGINTLGKDIYATYKSKYDVLSQLQAMGVVEFEKIGREVIAWLTPKGKLYAEYINKIMCL